MPSLHLYGLSQLDGKVHGYSFFNDLSLKEAEVSPKCVCGCNMSLLLSKHLGGYMYGKCASNPQKYERKLSYALIRDHLSSLRMFEASCLICSNANAVHSTCQNSWTLTEDSDGDGYIVAKRIALDTCNLECCKNKNVFITILEQTKTIPDHAINYIPEAFTEEAEKAEAVIVVLQTGNVIDSFCPQTDKFKRTVADISRHRAVPCARQHCLNETVCVFCLRTMKTKIPRAQVSETGFAHVGCLARHGSG